MELDAGTLSLLMAILSSGLVSCSWVNSIAFRVGLGTWNSFHRSLCGYPRSICHLPHSSLEWSRQMSLLLEPPAKTCWPLPSMKVPSW